MLDQDWAEHLRPVCFKNLPRRHWWLDQTVVSTSMGSTCVELDPELTLCQVWPREGIWGRCCGKWSQRPGRKSGWMLWPTSTSFSGLGYLWVDVFSPELADCFCFPTVNTKCWAHVNQWTYINIGFVFPPSIIPRRWPLIMDPIFWKRKL